MTEYDYSPDAYERYLATQDRVSRWVNKQAHHAREYGSPFVDPSVAGGETGLRSGSSSAGYRERSSGSSSRHGSTSPTSSSRPPPKRSHTTPAPVVSPSNTAYPVYPQPQVIAPPSRYKSTHHPSHSTHNVYQYQYQYQNPQPQVAYVSARDGYTTKTKTYTMEPNCGELHLPPPRRGEQYIIIPPKGMNVQVFHEHSDGTRSSSTSRSSSRSPRSPTKKDEPLLKRLFNMGGGGQKIKSSGSSSRRERRLSY